MKVRNGFVSNSSSSSFVCCISKETVEGWDYCLSEAGFVECENGHTFLEEYVLWNADIKKQVIAGYTDSDVRYYDKNVAEQLAEMGEDEPDLDNEYLRYELPACCCPVCTFDTVIDADIDSYVAKQYNISGATVLEWVKSKNKRRRVIRDGEYMTYAAEKYGVVMEDIVNKIREFNSYKEFRNYLTGN